MRAISGGVASLNPPATGRHPCGMLSEVGLHPTKVLGQGNSAALGVPSNERVSVSEFASLRATR